MAVSVEKEQIPLHSQSGCQASKRAKAAIIAIPTFLSPSLQAKYQVGLRFKDYVQRVLITQLSLYNAFLLYNDCSFKLSLKRCTSAV